MTEKAKSFFNFFNIGEYPPEYNPKIHGPYDPSRNYGKGRNFWLFALFGSQLCCKVIRLQPNIAHDASF